MKFSYQWIRELVPDLRIGTDDLYRLITTKTAECERIEAFGGYFASVVAARVVAVDALAKGKNKAVLIEAGEGRQVRVVCGAPNARAGMLAPWVPPGTAIAGRTIGSAVIEGVESEGMLASAAELGINRDHSGLLELNGVAPGESLPGLAPDWIIEIDNKSLTHRPDLWGHYGMAREVAAITRGSLRDPVDLGLLPRGEAALKIEIADHSLCPRYSALVLENITVAPSPLWLQARLESVGLNSINNLVDVTNFVLAELPQPMHAFDADKLAGDTIYVRPARAGEQLRALNGETYDLKEADLVIADASGPVALAGVIGGADTAISATTRRVVLESANFEASGVRLTSARHKLRTDASMRFEKSLDAENTVRGLARAVALLREVAHEARTAGGVIDNRVSIPSSEPIALPVDFVTRKLGKELGEDEVSEILRALGFGVTQTSPGLLTVTVPTWRATKDIRLKDDLVEEVGRMVGYSEIVPTPPLVASSVPPSNPMRGYLRKMCRALADQGFSEVYNYSFVTPAEAERFGFDGASQIEVRNPIASELSHLRRSLLPGLLKNVIGNARNFREFRLFEIGNEIHPRGSTELPDEIVHLAAVIYDIDGDERTFFETKRAAESIFPGASLSGVQEARAYEHPARSALIHWSRRLIGRLFELHPSVLAAEGIEGRAVFFDVDMQVASELAAERRTAYKAVRKYPTSGFDLSAVAEIKTPIAEVAGHLSRLGRDELVSLEFIRQYSGPPLLEGQKSVSFHLEIGAPDHTLSSDEASAIRQRIVTGMQEAGFEVRGRAL